MSIWERFDNIASADEVAEEINKFKPIEAGTYNMTLEKLEAGESKAGLPMVKGQFRTMENKAVFYNQMLQNMNYPEMTASNIAKAVDFVGKLLGEEIVYSTMGNFAKEIERVQTGEIYSVRVTYGKKDLDMKFPILNIE